MESKIFDTIGIDPGIIIIVLFMLIVVLFLLTIHASLKYSRLKTSYNSFMRGKDGRSLEESILDRFEELDELSALTMKNRADIKKIN